MPTTQVVTTNDGEALEAQLFAADDPWGVVVATHPHPLHGGDMHNPVPAGLSRDLPRRGLSVLRFNFRSVGGSTGVHGGGASERLDVLAAVDAATEAVPGVPAVIVGYSFGADVALTVVPDQLAGWVAIAPPLTLFPPEQFLAGSDDRPKLVASPAHDQLCPPAKALERTARWRSTNHEIVPNTDHFLAGAAGNVIDIVWSFCTGLATQH